MQMALSADEVEMPAAAVSPFDDLAAAHALYEGRVFRFLLYSVRDRDVAMTLTQETFLTAWRTRASFRGECSAATWLMQLALNLLRNHTRTARYKFWRSATVVDAADLTNALVDVARRADEVLATRDELKAVWAAVETLSPKQRTVFLLRFVDEMELPEIAAAMEMKEATVRSHLYRALDRVRVACGRTK